MNSPEYHGPAWDLSTEYESTSCPAIEVDLSEVTRLLFEVEGLNQQLDGDASVEVAQSIFRLTVAASRLLYNVSCFARCRLSVDSKDEEAQALLGRLKNVTKRYEELSEPLAQFTILASDKEIDAYLADVEVKSSAFTVHHARKRRDHLLSLREEQLVTSLSQDGIHAWGALYGQLSGTLRCAVIRGNELEEMGLAQAAALQSSPAIGERKAAWVAIRNAWEGHEETCAASLNAIAGWRLEMALKRGTKSPAHFLDEPVHMSRITRATLDTVMHTAATSRPLARRAAKLQARAYGETSLGPWDQRAPAPDFSGDGPRTYIPFADAISLIATAYGEVDGSMGDFVRMMADKRWIEGTVGPHKRPGAYCTGFAKSRTPRVYMTYDGAVGEVITLAHELGHAYHSWIMRDLHPSECGYGMSLAETASTFGETLVRDSLLARAITPADKLSVIWQEMEALVTFILNIPARFVFEKRFYERRAEGPLRPAEFKALMNEAWVECYADAIAEPDSMFWASKLHFFISGISFYNFPYLFGYLFSLGIYGKRSEYGDDFFPRYQALLRDTGRMTAEDLARTHLDTELAGAKFWTDTIATLAPRVDTFASLLDEVGLAAS